MTTFLTADFDTYTTIYDFIYDLYFDDEADFDFDTIATFAADLGVAFTRDDLTSILVDFDEM